MDTRSMEISPKDLLDSGTRVTVAALGSGALGWAIRHFLAKRTTAVLREDLDSLRVELAAEREASKWERHFAFGMKAQRKFHRLCEETEVDRVLLLVAVGKDDYSHTSAEDIYRHGEQEQFEYKDIPTDNDYRMRLNAIEGNEAGMHYTTSEMPADAMIRGFYEGEGVKSSLWFPLRTVKHPFGKVFSYFSYASHELNQMTPQTITKFRLITDEIRGSAIRRG